MKLFKCTCCGVVDNSAHVYISVPVSVEFRKDELYVNSDFGSSIYESPVQFNRVDKSMQCHNCDQDTITIIEVDECPHKWEISQFSSVRTCHWCRTVEKAQLIWEK